jgi:hypothetical protein
MRTAQHNTALRGMLVPESVAQGRGVTSSARQHNTEQRRRRFSQAQRPDCNATAPDIAAGLLSAGTLQDMLHACKEARWERHLKLWMWTDLLR